MWIPHSKVNPAFRVRLFGLISLFTSLFIPLNLYEKRVLHGMPATQLKLTGLPGTEQ